MKNRVEYRDAGYYTAYTGTDDIETVWLTKMPHVAGGATGQIGDDA